MPRLHARSVILVIEFGICSTPLAAGLSSRVMLIAHLQHERLLKDRLEAYALDTRHGFKVYNEVIAAPGDGLITFTCMQDHNAESIKSLEGYGRAWVEEAQTLSAL